MSGKIDDKKILKVLLSTLKKCGVKKGLEALDYKAAKKKLTETLAEGKMPEELSKDDVEVLGAAGFEVDSEEDKKESSSSSSSSSASSASSSSASSSSASSEDEKKEPPKKPEGKKEKPKPEKPASSSASSSSASSSASSSSASSEDEEKKGPASSSSASSEDEEKKEEKPKPEKKEKEAKKEDPPSEGKDWFKKFWAENTSAKKDELIKKYTKKFGEDKQGTIKSYIAWGLKGKFDFELSESNGTLTKAKKK